MELSSLSRNTNVNIPFLPPNLQQESILANTILVKEEPALVEIEQEVIFPDFQELVDQIDRLACYPQLVDSNQVASLPAQFNEALQREPCSLLEDYQVRFVQLRKVLIQAEQFSGAERLVAVLNQHLIHAEQAAKTLYLESATPVQDSLWHLYDRVLRLPTLEPDFFGAAVASLKEKLLNAVSFNSSTERLKGFLNELHPPTHYLWGGEAPFTNEIKKLQEIKRATLILCHHLKQAPEGYIKTFIEPMESIFRTYRDFLETFNRASDKKKQKLCLPKAQLSGPGLGFFLLDQSIARSLVSRDEKGKLSKKNSIGTHPVHCEADVFYKANSGNRKTCIHPELEFAIYALYQHLGREGVAAATLAKISHLFFEGQPDAQGATLQAGCRIKGVPLQDLLDIANVLPFLEASLGRQADEAFQWLMGEDWQQEVTHAHPDLNLAGDESAKQLLNAFKTLFERGGPRCLGFSNLELLYEIEKQFSIYVSKQSTVLLVGCLAILERYPNLAVTFSRDTERYKNGIRQVSYEELIGLQLSIQKIKTLFPNLSADRLLRDLPQLMRRVDSVDFSTHFVVTLLTNPRDHRVDNLMATLTANEQGGIHSFSLVGIDNDLVFASSEDSVRTILYLFPSMNIRFDYSVAQKLFELNSEEFILDWLIALEEQNQSYERWQRRGVKIEDSLSDAVLDDEKESSLNIPLKIAPSLVHDVYAKTKQLREMLEARSWPTHWEILKNIQPKLAEVYEQASELGDNPIMAYGEMERLFRKNKLPVPPSEKKPSPSISPAVAALQFLERLNLNSFPIEQQVPLIGKAMRTFPSSINSLCLPGNPADPLSRRDFFLRAVTQGYCALVARLLEEEKKSRLGKEEKGSSLIEERNEQEQTALLLACLRLDLEMIQLLIHYRADPNGCDINGRHAFTLCLVRFPEVPARAAAVIRFLAEQPAVFLNASNRYLGQSVLHYLIQVAEIAPEEAEPLIAYLIKKGANPDLVDNEGKSPLDYAIELGQERFVRHLIQLGAGRTLKREAACTFFQSRPHLKDTFALLQHQSLLLRWHLALEALRRISFSAGRGRIEGAQLGTIRLTSAFISKLVNDEGDIRSQIAYGRRNVNKLKLPSGHELYFKQFPEMPGVEYAIDTLFKLLIGHGTSFTDFARLTTATGKSYPVLISQAVQGENLHEVLVDPIKATQIEKLDPQHFSELVLASLLVNFEDAKPDNFIVEALPDGTFRLVGIDNDHAFVPPLVKGDNTIVQVKCILYCLDQMRQPLHPFARERFLSVIPERLLRLWLSKLQEQNQRYCALFSEKERKAFFKGSKEVDGLVIPIPFKPGTIIDIYQKFHRLQIALQDSPQLTGLEVLRLVIPPLGIRYAAAFDSDDTPLKRFHALTKTQYSMAIAGHYQTLVNSRQLLKSMKISEKAAWEAAAEQGPTLALKELADLEQEMYAARSKLCEIHKALQAGKVELFNQLQLDTSKEKIINGVPGAFDGIDFKKVPDQKQKAVLSVILKGNYRTLRIVGCATFDKAAFSQLLRNSPQLLSLDLRDCSKVDEELLMQLSQLSCLTHLRLSNLPQLVRIKLPHPTLRQLEIVHCQALESLTVSHTLKNLSLVGCWSLSSTDARLYEMSGGTRPKLRRNEMESGSNIFGSPKQREKAPKGGFILQRFHLMACPKLQPWRMMFESWLRASSKHEIMLENVPLNPTINHSGLVAKAVIARPEAKEMLSSLANWAPDTTQIISILEKIHSNSPKEVDFSSWKEINDSLLRMLVSNHPGFTGVNLSGCEEISYMGLSFLFRSCPGLTTVNLSKCRVDDDSLLTLSKYCPGLTSVVLSDCKDITDIGLQALLKSCVGLTTLNLAGCCKITNASLRLLYEQCDRLTRLDLSRCTQIDQRMVEQFLRKRSGNRSEVLSLNLSGCDQIISLNLRCTEAGPTSVGVRDEELVGLVCPSLTKLNLSGSEDVTDNGLVGLAAGCPGLTSVDLSTCYHDADRMSLFIGDLSLEALSKGCPYLTFVDLGGCDRITDAGLLLLASGCAALTEVNLWGCKKITSAGKEAFKATRPNIKIKG